MKKILLFLCVASITLTAGCQSKQISSSSSGTISKCSGINSSESFTSSSNSSRLSSAKASSVSSNGSPCVNTQIAPSDGHLKAAKKVESLDKRGVSSLNNFAVNLYSKLYEKDKNIFFSPASIYLALGMTYNGAAGNTAKSMASVLGISSLSLNEYNNFSRDLQYSLLGNKYARFELANSMWVNSGYSKNFKQDFLKRNTDYYGAMVSTLNFSDPKSLDIINNWVKQNTNSKIPKAITDPIRSGTVMYLINTMYFKANWALKFDKAKTTDDSFLAPGGSKKVKMMHRQEAFMYAENDLMQIIKLRYNYDASMFVLLPKGSLSDLQPQITYDNLTKWLNSTQDQHVNVSLPQFKFDYDANLNNALSSLGMSDAFTPNADFSNMMSERGVYIDKATHKTFISVDEEGTEAAATTVIGMTKGIATKIYEMNINHPFVFGIVDDVSGAILFLGVVSNP